MTVANLNAENDSPVLLLYGGADKSAGDMTTAELAQLAEDCLRRAREKAFSKGLPIYSYADGQLWAEHPDGHREVVRV